MIYPTSVTPEGNERPADYIHALFESRLAKHRERTAVIFGDQSLTYQQLDNRATTLSKHILLTAPVAPIIGISTTRGIDMVIGVLAILKSGKAYLPLDPSYPADRIQQVVQGAALQFCIASGNDELLFIAAGLTTIGSPVREESGNIVPVAAPHLAYVLFTSGSTGIPKGVAMGHRALANLLTWQEAASIAKAGDRTLQFAPLSFDVSFQEIFATLTTGGTLVLIEDKLRLDPVSLLEVIRQHHISRIFLPFIALQYLAEMAVSFNIYPACLREIITAGEQLKITPPIAAFIKQLPGCILYNQYGPTECHVVTELRLTGDPEAWPALPSIGTPISGVEIYIAGEYGESLGVGETGELLIAGKCLAEGYLHQPALSEQKFTNWMHPEKGSIKVYRSGDLAKYRANGEIEFLGRMDGQVKIRGNRIELGEIEVVLSRHPAIKQVAIVAREDQPGQKYLAAYYITGGEAIPVAALRDYLGALLPDYMVPTYFIPVTEFPYTSSGKVNRLLLPAPEAKRPEDLGTIFRKPLSDIEKNIAQTWAKVLHLDKIGLDDNFFELGGNSLLAQKTVATIYSDFKYNLPITKLYQFPTITGVAAYFEKQKSSTIQLPEKTSRQASGGVAIIGMAGRFPGADTVEALWEILKEGRETIRFFSKEELDPSISKGLANDPDYVAARGIISGADQFDAAFFDINPKLAELMDPQQRIFLEIAWEVLEKTGHLPHHYHGVIGVFAGTGNDSYYFNNVQGNTKLVEQQGAFQVMTVNEKDYVASRASYQLNLKGPAVSVHSGCSTSLLAVAQAVESIRNGQTDIAIAGGASVTAPIHSGHLYQEGAMLSRDGHCKSFDADATGTVFSDGAGVVLLKDLDSATRDGDTIYGVIKGVGVNNDGGGKGSFTAPSSEGQANAIAMALRDAGFDPATLQYIETHGTATPLGDPIEIEGLTLAFGAQANHQYCAIGSVKSNLGHLTAAAGVTGLIKTALALHHQKIPASLGFSQPNPNINFRHSPFYVNTQLSDWPAVNTRRAGVSSFGVGGTNVHVVLEGVQVEVPGTSGGRGLELFTWSAKSPESLSAYAKKLKDFAEQQPGISAADIAYTLQNTRGEFAHRSFVLAGDRLQLAAGLQSEIPTHYNFLKELPDEIVFLFPGQGAQFINMGLELYRREAVYRDTIDDCATLLIPYLDADIREIIFPADNNEAAALQLKNTLYTQPALFVTEYALARLWMSWGITPSIFAGHSIGEFVAACLAGVFSLADALHLIAVRAKLVSSLPTGDMLSVRAAVADIEPMLPPSLSIAAVNSVSLCVVAGEPAPIAAFAIALNERSVANKLLHTSHAFHSAMMDSIVDPFKAVVAGMQLNFPRKPIVSTVTGTWLSDTEATDPGYWAAHLRCTVQFSRATDTLLQHGKMLFVEVGPGNVLCTLLRQQATGKLPLVLTSLENNAQQQSGYESILKALGQAWLNGITPDWKAFYSGQQRAVLNLPTYAFNRKYCWVAPPLPLASNAAPLHWQQAAAKAIPVPNAHLLPDTQPIQTMMRKEHLVEKIKELLEDASGIDTAGASPQMSFLELGLDSLLLTQMALTFKKEFGLPLTFRQLNEEFATIDSLANYLDKQLPAGQFQPVAPAAPPVAREMYTENVTNYAAPSPSGNNIDSNLELVAQQLQLLAKQVSLLQGNRVAPVPVPPATPVITTTAPPSKAAPFAAELSEAEALEIKKPFGATARIDRQVTALSNGQKEFLLQLTEKYNRKTLTSKVYAQQHRATMADPRVVSGFKPLTKEIVYPIVVNKSAGSKLWDVDGNEYIDVLNGFGSSLLGFQPDIIKKALHEQIDIGFEVGPQHPLAGEVCQLACELTGADRAALCSTGSEAVLGTMRIARTVSGRSLIVAFTGSYHGIADEVIVRGTRKLKSYPAAPGIMPEAVQNMLILDYGTAESLEIIRQRAHELAAVLVEPIQSRRPEFRPVAFLQQVRDITAASGTALIFDEVITGFRMHPGGAQAIFGIKADIASYGKVAGGGIPIGIIAGKKEWMDALDGGHWQYGDASYPEVGVTYFAGTFVRHPLALAAAKVSLQYMKDKGPALQEGLNAKGDRLARVLNEAFEQRQLPFFIAQYGSLWKIKFHEEVPYGELLFTLMRYKGVHVWDGFPCFMTEAITDAEIDTVIRLFIESADELIAAGFFNAVAGNNKAPVMATTMVPFEAPPAPGAKLGRDKEGNPAWFIADKDRPGKYFRFELNK